ncbi:YegP family protein [uncultured Spirosoma sp.]|uniref:YegP family protein n=1 Tax=uncultured Spirosoma sp. TaxID=278208 RepID=UPI00338DC135
MGRFKIFLNRSHYYFALISDSGYTLLTSNPYNSEYDCRNGINLLKQSALIDSNFVRNKSDENRHFFELKGMNGAIIAKSDLYSSISGLENSIASVKRNILFSYVTHD